MVQPAEVSRPDKLTEIILCGIASLLVFAAIASLPDLLDQCHLYILLSVLAFALMLAAYRVGRNLTRRMTIAAAAFAVLFRIAMLFSPVTLSQDIYRYVWDGRVSAHGVNPYRYLPKAPELESLRDDDVYPNISSIDHYTVYPPLAEAMFAAGAWLGDPSVLPIKIIFALFDLGCLALLIPLTSAMACERRNILLWAWNPLPIAEFAGSGHSDSMMIFFLLLAVWLWSTGRKKGGWLAIGGSIAARLVPVVTFPLALAVLKPRRILTPLFWSSLALVVCFAPYLTDFHLVRNWSESSRLYAGTFIFNASFFEILLWARQAFHLFYPATEIPRLALACNLVFGAIWIAAIVVFWRRRNTPSLSGADGVAPGSARIPACSSSQTRDLKDYLTVTAWLFATYFLLTPNVQVWYVTWPAALVPLIYSSNTAASAHARWPWREKLLEAVSRPHTALLVWSGTAVLAYEGYAGETYGVPAPILWAEYGTFFLFAAMQVWNLRKRNVAMADAQARTA